MDSERPRKQQRRGSRATTTTSAAVPPAQNAAPPASRPTPAFVAPPPIIVHLGHKGDKQGLTEDEKAYITTSLHDKERKRVNNVVKMITQQNAEPIRIRVLRSNLPTSCKAQIFKRLQQCDNEKYNDWVERALRLPLGRFSKPHGDNAQEMLLKSQMIMDGAITGHAEAKTAVLHLLCAWIRDGASGGFSLALEGEPGTGKTTFVKEALAACVKRPFYFVSLGGATDAASLIGHSFTYEGALPGRICECLTDAQVMDPIIFFDELDKVSATAKGAEIINTLIHMVDPTQNAHIRDKYFHGIDLDLSRAIMIFSYNDPMRVDPVLLDRLQRVRMHRPTISEKCDITRKHLFPRHLERMGMVETKITDDIVEHIVEQHREDVGMRSVEKSVRTVVSSLALAHTYGDAKVLGDGFDKVAASMDLKFVKKVMTSSESTGRTEVNHCSSMYL